MAILLVLLQILVAEDAVAHPEGAVPPIDICPLMLMPHHVVLLVTTACRTLLRAVFYLTSASNRNLTGITTRRNLIKTNGLLLMKRSMFL